MTPQKHNHLIPHIKDILRHEGAAAFVTTGPDGPHLVATWQSYMDILDETTIAFPAGGYYRTEEHIRQGSPVQMIVTSRNDQRWHTYGGGYRLRGQARFETTGPVYDRIKERFPWARAAVIFHIESVEELR